MTTDELRDRLAKAFGFHKTHTHFEVTYDEWRAMPEWLRRIAERCQPTQEGLVWRDPNHPIPPNDLNALAAVWREELKGWSWARWGDGVWIAQPPGVNPKLVEVPDTGDEYHDRLALTLACVEAEKGTK